MDKSCVTYYIFTWLNAWTKYYLGTEIQHQRQVYRFFYMINDFFDWFSDNCTDYILCLFETRMVIDSILVPNIACHRLWPQLYRSRPRKPECTYPVQTSHTILNDRLKGSIIGNTGAHLNGRVM